MLVALMCLMLCFILASCESDQSLHSADTSGEDNYPISGHILYGYKHGIKVYGQYMDQAGEDNAMLLVFLKKEEGCTADVKCTSVTINDCAVEFTINTEEISSDLSAWEVIFTSATTKIDALNKEDNATIVLEIYDSASGNIIEVTQPLKFPCN